MDKILDTTTRMGGIMKPDVRERIIHIRGNTPYEIGVAFGRHLGPRLEKNICDYLAKRPQHPINVKPLREGALPWLRQLPQRFQEECAGLADGSRLPLVRIAEWIYIEPYLSGCSTTLYRVNNRVWGAHNNDAFVPDIWGYMTIREINDRLKTVCFGLEGDVFTTVGINQARLWLTINNLPVSDSPSEQKLHLPSYVFLVEALETCQTVEDIERLLTQIDRDDGMLLFVIDGKADIGAVFECSCQHAVRCDLTTDWLVRTNHYCVSDGPGAAKQHLPNSLTRFKRMEQLIRQLYNPLTTVDLPKALIRILADDEVERRDEVFATVYSTVVCPSTAAMWYTFGGYPAASNGNWSRVKWPWAA